MVYFWNVSNGYLGIDKMVLQLILIDVRKFIFGVGESAGINRLGNENESLWGRTPQCNNLIGGSS